MKINKQKINEQYNKRDNEQEIKRRYKLNNYGKEVNITIQIKANNNIVIKDIMVVNSIK